jgi:hypothetical protein
MRSNTIAQGLSVGVPNISELKKFPKRTNAAVSAPGTVIRAMSQKRKILFYKP